MLHLLMNKEPWFRAKRFGYGAGLPFKWQGWVLLISHVAAIIGVVVFVQDRPTVFTLPVLLIAIAPIPIYAARTEGGWKWRWGGWDGYD